MNKDTWLKLHTSLLMSEKFRFLPTNDHRLTYILLLLLQKKGLIQQPDEFTSAMVFVSKSKLKKIKSDLVLAGLLNTDETINNFEDMQLSPDALKKRNQRSRDNTEETHGTNTGTNGGTCPGTSPRDSRKQKADKERRRILTTVDNPTKGTPFPSTAGSSPEIPPAEFNKQIQKNHDSREPTPEQSRMLTSMAQERGLDVAEIAVECEMEWPLVAGSAGDLQLAVSTVKARIMELGDMSKTKLKAYHKRAELDRHWEKLRPYLMDPERISREIELLAESDQRTAMVLLNRTVDWIRTNTNDERSVAHLNAGWDVLENLPAVYSRAGIGQGHGDPAPMAQAGGV